MNGFFKEIKLLTKIIIKGEKDQEFWSPQSLVEKINKKLGKPFQINTNKLGYLLKIQKNFLVFKNLRKSGVTHYIFIPTEQQRNKLKITERIKKFLFSPRTKAQIIRELKICETSVNNHVEDLLENEEIKIINPNIKRGRLYQTCSLEPKQYPCRLGML